MLKVAHFPQRVILLLCIHVSNMGVVEPVQELSTVPLPDHNFPRIDNIFATAGDGLFARRLQAWPLCRCNKSFTTQDCGN